MPQETGVLPFQHLAHAVRKGWVSSPRHPIEQFQFQPASLDLRLGSVAYRIRSSFLSGRESVQTKLESLTLYDIPLAPYAVLERGHVYLIPLLEELSLPAHIRAKANPKSSTGRLDIFTRVITDTNQRFDDIRPGYHGQLYLEVFSRSFTIKIHQGLSLNQLRLFAGYNTIDDAHLRHLYNLEPLLYDGHNTPIPLHTVQLDSGLFMGIDTIGGADRIVGYKAKKNSDIIDLSQTAAYDPAAFWEPIYHEANRPLILEPEDFYILASKERVAIPPDYAAELVPYDPGSGELRTHYAGFFDPGFGYRNGVQHGTKAVLEVRPHDVPFLIEDGQLFCKLCLERMIETPQVTYGSDLNSHYQSQSLTLSKQFIAWQPH